jgi:hypothetical protein
VVEKRPPHRGNLKQWKGDLLLNLLFLCSLLCFTLKISKLEILFPVSADLNSAFFCYGQKRTDCGCKQDRSSYTFMTIGCKATLFFSPFSCLFACLSSFLTHATFLFPCSFFFFPNSHSISLFVKKKKETCCTTR